MDWLLYDNDLRHDERVNRKSSSLVINQVIASLGEFSYQYLCYKKREILSKSTKTYVIY